MTDKTFSIIIENLTLRIIWLGPANITPPDLPPCTRLTGEVAAWLFIALTGHRTNQPINQTSLFRTRAARSLIRQRAGHDHDYLRALAVVQQWGSHIRPNPAANCPICIDLFTGRAFDGARSNEP
jgi:hypothetical protein